MSFQILMPGKSFNEHSRYRKLPVPDFYFPQLSRAHHSPQPLERPCLQRCGHLSGDKSGRVGGSFQRKNQQRSSLFLELPAKSLSRKIRTINEWMPKKRIPNTRNLDATLLSNTQKWFEYFFTAEGNHPASECHIVLASWMKLNSFLLENIVR